MLSRPSNISYLLVSISIDPKDLPTFVPAFKECYLNVIAEPDCFMFQVLYDEKQPGVFKFIEGWARDKEWLLNVQIKKDYYAPYLAITEKQWISPREILVLSDIPEFAHIPRSSTIRTAQDITFFIVTIHVAPSDVDSFLQVLKDTSYAGVISEPECFIFEVLHDKNEPGVLRLIEGWTEGKDWCEQVQMKKPYYAPYMEKAEKMWIKPREILLLGRKEGFGYVDEQTIERWRQG